MSIVDVVIKTTHDLNVILVVTLSELNVLVCGVVSKTKVDIPEEDMVKGAIGKIILHSYQHHIPSTALANLLINILLDTYRIGLDLTASELHDINITVREILKIVRDKTSAIAGIWSCDLIGTTVGDYPVGDVMVVSSTDLIKFKNIELRLYKRRHL